MKRARKYWESHGIRPATDFALDNCGAPTGSITKRTILSEIASLFDPLGLLGLLTVVAKMIMQDTWQSHVGWDESLPQDLHQRWLDIKQQLKRLHELRVPRFVGFWADARESHVHGFSALRVAVRCVQRHAFPGEHKQLTEGRSVDGGSRILSLTPFMDEHEINRVGGRINNATLPYDARHPVLLPKSHRLTILIIQREHVKNLHSGLQATMHAVRRRFWPLAARSAVRKTIHNCVTCFRCKPAVSQALMADLPAQRVTASRPFTHSGVDYAGPILLKKGKRRNAKLHKAYMSVFVCFSTRAVHLEIVTDLTSEAFLGAFKRFISRRGRPACVYSDNGTTFVGTRKQIKELYDLINDDDTQLAIQRFMRDNEINWHFIPPHAPHVGGLWEAAVKSVKFHINRIVGNANLTYKEMQTVLCEIEAVLNLRPLTPLSEDPNDLHCITPGHFLIGAALNSFRVADLTKENPGRLLRWQRVE
ncbi:uncharacterized protein LOC114942137 [Nylanderia fulva]|uniref:uncharacterized protein LOC114942137 n=1 Tax=Nylanderia fulva TaxID=613905 RepID=UPI0010FADE7D|nr:uncharacterized protein LOC114942137 [Nylanderia fulva]